MHQKQLTQAELNHLRKLLGWIDCEIGQSPEELLDTTRSIAPAVGEVDDAAKKRMVEAYQKAQRVPQYVRAAVKALRKTVTDKNISDAEIIDPNPILNKQIDGSPALLKLPE